MQTFVSHFHSEINHSHSAKVWAPARVPKMMGGREGAVQISLERGGSSRSAREHTMYQLGLVWEVKPSLPFQSVLGLEDSTAAASYFSF